MPPSPAGSQQRQYICAQARVCVCVCGGGERRNCLAPSKQSAGDLSRCTTDNNCVANAWQDMRKDKANIMNMGAPNGRPTMAHQGSPQVDAVCLPS
jgi:hypothetical protein